MARKAPDTDIDEAELRVSEPKARAAGVPGVVHALQASIDQMGVVRSAQTLLRVNQKDGFDCMGCAWPEGDHRHTAEFCENGAKAVAEEATRRRVGRAFFAEHSIDDLRGHDDYWLGQQGRLTEPMLLEEGATHYAPISWDDAFRLIGDELRAMDDPGQAIFYTSGRTSNEAAFAYQLLVRGLGTNNLPDCSNMCHESSGSALTETLGIGKGTVSLEDLHEASLIIVAGQNPGTNHPRMLSALEKAKRRGATIVAVNPLPEAGLIRFVDPQSPRDLAAGGTKLADRFLQIRLGGDQALFQALGALLLELHDERGGVLDEAFIAAHTSGFDDYAADVRALDWAEVETATGLAEAEIREVGAMVADAPSAIVCWAMGLTQHPYAVATLRDVVNLLLLQGNVGRPGAGVCPVRGHSNVQGDRTMGIFERMPEWFHDAIDREFAFASPRAHGYDTVEAIRAMRDGRARVFLGMGGNFVRATPDTAVTERALANLDLTVQVSTKLNRSHLVTGRRALILPTLGRTERDAQATGDQRVTVEDSMGMVHASRGRLRPASDDLLSEVAIVTRIAEEVFASGHPPLAPGGAPAVDWAAWRGDYAQIRRSISAVVPGFEGLEEAIADGESLRLPNAPRDDRRFATATGRARFTANALTYPEIPSGCLLLQTLRSHDQYNTTIYGKDDRYRGIAGGRRVVMLHPDDIAAAGFADGDLVDLVAVAPDRVERRAPRFRIVSYSTPRGNAAAYYPETNVLVPLDSVADVSNTPASKSVLVRLEAASAE
ncbi:formate dehydrogenase [Agromyces rhizosphaerae]|uniref:Formate dehydrogenase n=1 Tax=Agromyces rhizosphaerae TaxID=88374 RepID=A0A9W6CYQ5_9MICO|nr:FdhF/YdeP family oxidoreductase [Agromyces rhizosphaerae]GLI28100.1 formate dehydrogenase [Agromyces rhizosphaerae]